MYILLFSYIYSAYRPNYIQIITPSGKNLHLGSNVLSESNSEAVLNLFRDRLRLMLKQMGVRDRQSIAGYWQKSRDSRCQTGAQYGRNIPYLLEMIILFLYKFKTASKFLLAYIKKFYEYCKQEISRKGGCVGINLTSFYLNWMFITQFASWAVWKQKSKFFGIAYC